MIRVAQEKINKLPNEKNKVLIEQFKTNRRRVTTLKQSVIARYVFIREAISLNLRLNEMKPITAGVVHVSLPDPSELEAKVTVYMGALQTQLTQTAGDNLQISGEFGNKVLSRESRTCSQNPWLSAGNAAGAAYGELNSAPH